MLKRVDKGYTMELKLPESCGKGYWVICTYRYSQDKEKYLLGMRLKREDFDESLKISTSDIDTQEISGTRENIRSNIIKLVEYMAEIGAFEDFITAYEYQCECFDCGDKILGKKN